MLIATKDTSPKKLVKVSKVYLHSVLTKSVIWLCPSHFFSSYWMISFTPNFKITNANRMLILITALTSSVLESDATGLLLRNILTSRLVMLSAMDATLTFASSAKNQLMHLWTAYCSTSGSTELAEGMRILKIGSSLIQSSVQNAKMQLRRIKGVCIWHAGHVNMSSVGYVWATIGIIRVKLEEVSAVRSKMYREWVEINRLKWTRKQQ